jgi:hypothetical protein
MVFEKKFFVFTNWCEGEVLVLLLSKCKIIGNLLIVSHLRA